MKNITAKVTVEYLDFYEGFSFQLDDNLLLKFEEFKAPFSILNITGTCDKESSKQYIKNLLNKFLDLLNFQKDIAAKDFSFSDYQEEEIENREPSFGKASRNIGLYTCGKQAITKEITKTLNKKYKCSRYNK